MISFLEVKLKRSKAALYSYLCLFSFAGYPAFGLLTSSLDWPSVWGSLCLRFGVASLALVLIYQNWRCKRIGFWSVFLLGWLALYSIRLIGNMLAGFENSAHELGFFVLVVLLPVLALTGISDRDFYGTLNTSLLCLCVGTLLFAIISEYLNLFGSNSLTFSGRLSTINVNPIALGFIADLCLLTTILCKERLTRLHYVFVFLLAVIGILGLSMTGTRGTIVGLLGTLFVLIFAYSKRYNDGSQMVLPILIGLSAIIISLKPVPMSYLIEQSYCNLYSKNNAKLLGVCPPAEKLELLVAKSTEVRVERANFSDQSNTNRLSLWTKSIHSIIKHPFLGESNWKVFNGSYPHNFTLEAFQNAGLFGGLGFVGLTIMGLYRAWQSLLCGDALIPGVFLLAFFMGQFSGSLFAAASFWICLALLLNEPPDNVRLN